MEVKPVKKFTCVCGREFDNSQRFNGHKAHCKQHLISKGLTDEEINHRQQKHISWLHSANNKKNNLNKELKSASWSLEKHTCEKCGKIMAEKFGSGRFCSRACANSHRHSKETRGKISSSIKKYNIERGHFNRLKTCRCIVCGKSYEIPSRSNRKTCSKECLHDLKVQRSIELIKSKGYHKTIYSQYKFGTYRGFECDSSWELAFVVYCLDNLLPIQRNRSGFDYMYKGFKRTFFPDFIIGNIYYEIKGVWTEQVIEKVNQFPKDRELIILDRKNIKKYINYCRSTYGDNFAEILYDHDKPNWTQSYKYKHFVEKCYCRKSISNAYY